ncbi:hypothetical protein HO173_008682 [Letharia columbiana]|uniref:Uncharacterized protein n=1 Tax=Letharia columbiana TaxID=112416 RepID=A0A8H6FR34_9LECA|nr:uncharacterized protein HO173_008682 [Letharia columbiana]KAF6233138.1 hypothetical protein HO173_008682 [Letharia columbiana]
MHTNSSNASLPLPTSEFEMSSDKAESQLELHLDPGTIKGTTPPQDPDSETLKPFRAMNLPQELRDRIYRELLLPDKCRISRATTAWKGRAESPYSLQPMILRASKQVHEEASRVLYKETNWVLLTADEGENFLGKSSGLLQDFRQMLYPRVSMQHLQRFPGTPVLRIELRDGGFLPRRDKIMMLITQQDVHFFFVDIPPTRYPEINLHFDAQAMLNPRTHDVLLDCCRDIRGMGQITISGFYSFAVYSELLAHMKRPIRHVQEFSERADRYKERGDLQLALRHLLDAADIYLAGWALLQSFFSQSWTKHLSGANPRSIAELKGKLINFSTECANCLTKAGIPKRARELLDITIQNAQSTGLRSHDYSMIYYNRGLALVAERNDIQAAKEFRVVLCLQRGHEGADGQVDAMEARLQDMPQTTRCTLEAYLKDIMKPYRHREPWSGLL